MIGRARFLTFVLEPYRICIRVHSNSEWQVETVVDERNGKEVDFYEELTDAQRDAIDAQAIEEILSSYMHWADILFEQHSGR